MSSKIEMQTFVVYDIGAEGYPYWWVLGACLAFLLLGIAISKTPKIWISWIDQDLHYRVFAKMVIGISALAASLFLLLSLPSYLDVTGAYQTGDYEVSSGKITDFEPHERGQNVAESFQVDGVRFSYSSTQIRPGFKQTRELHGPVSNGAFARVFHRKGVILRLELDQVHPGYVQEFSPIGQ